VNETSKDPSMIDLNPACDQMIELVSGVADEQLSGPTPCTEYTIGDLIDHVDLVAQGATTLARGSEVPDTVGRIAACSGIASLLHSTSIPTRVIPGVRPGSQILALSGALYPACSERLARRWARAISPARNHPSGNNVQSCEDMALGGVCDGSLSVGGRSYGDDPVRMFRGARTLYTASSEWVEERLDRRPGGRAVVDGGAAAGGRDDLGPGGVDGQVRDCLGEHGTVLHSEFRPFGRR
jgi:hypothetical protein